MAQPIFLYWHQGWDKAPELVQRCADSWIHHHQNTQWEVHLLHRGNIEPWVTRGNAEDWASLLRFEERMAGGENVGGLAHFADLLRLSLLDTHGGVWTDATTLCFKSLDEWLPSACTMGMPRSLAPSRRTETWFIDNRCKDPILGLWKKRFRDLYFSQDNRITYLSDWGIPPHRLTYWMVNLAMRNQSWAMRIWNSKLALNLCKVRSYFATNHILEYVLRNQVSEIRQRNLHHLILPIDAELIWEVHQSKWGDPTSAYMEQRLQAAPLIKLTHKATIPTFDNNEGGTNSAWHKWAQLAGV